MNRTKLLAKRERKADEFHDGKVKFPSYPWEIAAGDGYEMTRRLNEIKHMDRELGDGRMARFGGRR